MTDIETEARWAERFDRDVQTILQSGNLDDLAGLPQDYREALALAHTLRVTDMAQLSRSRESLRQKIARSGRQREVGSNTLLQGVQTMKTGFSAHSPARRAVTMAAMLALFLALLLTFQPVRALAGQILNQIGFFTFTNEPAIPEEWIGQESFNSAAQATPLPVEDLRGLTEEAAELQAGFSLYTPGYLPECFSLNNRSILREQDRPAVMTAYHCPGKTVYEDVFLYIDQSPLGGESQTGYPIGDARPVEVTVRGQKGLWIEQAPTGVQSNREGKTELMPVNLLLWEQDGFFFQMRSNHLSQAEMMKVAESLE